MRKLKFSSIFSSVLVIVMLLSLLSPITATADTEQSNSFKQFGLDESTLALKQAILEQQELSEDSPKLHSDLQNVSGSEEVAVIIQLSEYPVALEKGIRELQGESFNSFQESRIKQNVQQQQNSVTKEMILNGISFEKGFSYDTVLNGFSAKVKAEDIAKLLNIKGVTLVEPDTTVYASSIEDANSLSTSFSKDGELEATMNTSIDFLGIEKLWHEGYEGQGISVAVIDTGIDTEHPEFQGIYKGGKNFVPHTGDNYARPRDDNDASETSPLDRPGHRPEIDRGRTFYTDHGTHVAGTIAAIGANEYGIKGIASKIDLYAYRVLGAYGSGTTSSVIAAIDYAVKQDIDIINLSLGGGPNSETDVSSFAINNAMMAGTISVIATGNSGPDRGSMGSPATARLGIAVGNTTNPETIYDGQVKISVGTYKYSEQLGLMATTFGQDLATQLEGEFEVVAVPGFGKPSDFEGIDVDGKVALISRGGQIPFVDKIESAKEAGAVATIIHNNAGAMNAPNASGTYLSDSFDYIPTFDMSQTDGEKIRLKLKEGEGTVTFGNFGTTTTLGDEVNNSSSRGPSTPNFDIKPDVVAPGTNIMSTIPMYKADFPEAEYDQAYDRKTGTSMATPHITGIAALILQANPTWSPFDVKVALSNTAKVLNVAKYDVFAQGAGRVDAYAAAHPTILAMAIDTAVLDASGEIVENLKGTVTFGPQKLEEDITVTKEILVKDYSGKGGSVTVTVTPTKEFGDATLTIDNPTFTLEPNGEQLIKVTLKASQAETQIGDEFLGYIEITSNATSSISLPFAADFGGADPLEIKDVYIDNTDLSFNGDGKNDSAEFNWTNTGDLGSTIIELWDYRNSEGGPLGDGYIGSIYAFASIPIGSWYVPIEGTYTNYTTKIKGPIPDGLYTIDITDIDNHVYEYTEPVFVKSTKPEIDGSVSDGKLVGQVTDKYIEFIEELNNNWYFDYDLNTKLSASYVIGLDGEPTPFELNQDGSFELEIGAENVNKQITITVEDAAGNISDPFVLNAIEDDVTLSVDPESLDLTTGETEQLTVTEITTPAEGEPTSKDVTEEASYSVEDSSIATVSEKGLVTAKNAGETTITVTYGEDTVTVNVKVTAAPTVPSTPSTPSPSTPSGEVNVDANTITNQVKDTTKGEVKVELPALSVTQPKVSAKIQSSSVKEIAESSKPLVLTSGKIEVTVPNSVLKAIAANSPDSVTISVGSSKSTDINGAVSEIYEFTITTVKNGKSETFSVFSEPVTVTVPVADTIKDPRKVAAYYINESTNSLDYVGGNYNNGKLTFNTNHFSKFVVIESNLSFGDITNHWAKDAIEVLASRKITSGKTNATFNPEHSLTRAEFATLLVRALNIPTSSYEGIFPDVTEEQRWSVLHIEAAYRAGLVYGDLKGQFNPQNKLTREQMATMIVRAIEYKNASLLEVTTTASKFADETNISLYAKNAVQQAATLKIIKGIGNNKFAPLQITTRAEAAVMLYKLLELLEEI